MPLRNASINILRSMRKGVVDGKAVATSGMLTGWGIAYQLCELQFSLYGTTYYTIAYKETIMKAMKQIEKEQDRMKRNELRHKLNGDMDGDD